MLTIDDVAAISLFSGLSAVDLERLARTSADLHLGTGEFAVHEGGEGALFVVLTGKIEVVKMFDGIERRLGWRVPGTIFGEVPLALGSPFPGGYRAAEPSRVMRVDVQQYVEGRRPEGQRACARATGRAPEHHRRTAETASDIDRTSLGYSVRRPAPVSGAQPDFLQLADARCGGAVNALAWNASTGGW